MALAILTQLGGIILSSTTQIEWLSGYSYLFPYKYGSIVCCLSKDISLFHVEHLTYLERVIHNTSTPHHESSTYRRPYDALPLAMPWWCIHWSNSSTRSSSIYFWKVLTFFWVYIDSIHLYLWHEIEHPS